MKKMSKLQALSCYKCGSKPEIKHSTSQGNKRYHTGCCLVLAIACSEKEAIKCWNKYIEREKGTHTK